MRRAVAALAAAGVAGAVAAKKVDDRWRANDGDLDLSECVLPAGRRERVVTDDGAELAVSIVGPDSADAPTVLLAHCWLGAREVWSAVAHRLAAEGRRVVLYDQRGHGSSSVGSEGYTIPRLGADMRAVAESVNVRNAVFAGHSMGGMTVMSFAAHHPEALFERGKAVVLVATGASGLTRGALVDKLQVRAIGSRRIEKAMQGRMRHAWTRSVMGQVAQRTHMVTTADCFVATDRHARGAWLAAINGMDLREGIKTIGAPTTVLVGTRDTLTPKRYAQELVDTIPGAELRVLPGKGHMLPMEAPAEVTAALLEASS